MIKNVILGAGIAGIGAGFKLGENAIIYEARNRFGGLIDNFIINGFRFDHAIHLSFTKNQLVRSIFDQVPYYIHQPTALNYSDGYWVKHPVQNNSFALPVEERINIINSFINRTDTASISNYEEWLKYQFGQYFADKYPTRYTRKYWGCEPANLSVEWIKNRMYQPSIDEVLQGAMTAETPNTYYTQEMRYPANGGYRSFIEQVASGLNIQLNHRVVQIDAHNKNIFFENGKQVFYETLISSLPLPLIISLLQGCPTEVQKAANNLCATSVCLVSVGFNKEIDIPSLWFYVYDEDIPFARAYSPSMKSKNNAPEGKSSLQFEIYYSKNNPLQFSDNELQEKVIDAIEKMDIASKLDIEIIDTRHLDYANVVFYNGMEHDRKIVLDYLGKLKIKSIGRFGEWDYLWSDQSFLSGYSVDI